MAANLASSAASSILDSILVGSDFPIVHLLSLFFFEMSIAKRVGIKRYNHYNHYIYYIHYIYYNPYIHYIYNSL